MASAFVARVSFQVGGRWDSAFLNGGEGFAMNITRWWETATFSIRLRLVFGKRLWRRDNPLLLSGPVLSPPPGLGRSLKDRGRRPARLGTPRHSVASSNRLLVARCLFGAEARSFTGPLFLAFSVCDSSPQAACHFLLTRKSFQSVFRDLLMNEWFLGFYSFDICLRQLTSWPNLITCKGSRLTVPITPPDIGGCVLLAVICCIRNSNSVERLSTEVLR